jgi:hypothetical protein
MYLGNESARHSMVGLGRQPQHLGWQVQQNNHWRTLIDNINSPCRDIASALLTS